MQQEIYFFSYSRIDSDFALKLANDLQKAGVDVWVDQLHLTPGGNWNTEIDAALKRATTVIVLLSPNSVASDNVSDEVTFAKEKKKRIIPILLRQCEIPFWLNRLQRIDFTLNYDRAFKSLVFTLNKFAPADKQGDSIKNDGIKFKPPFPAVSKPVVKNVPPVDNSNIVKPVQANTTAKADDKVLTMVPGTAKATPAKKTGNDHPVARKANSDARSSLFYSIIGWFLMVPSFVAFYRAKRILKLEKEFPGTLTERNLKRAMTAKSISKFYLIFVSVMLGFEILLSLLGVIVSR